MEALKALGMSVGNAFLLDRPDQELALSIREAFERLAGLLKAIGPDLVICPAPFDAHAGRRSGSRVAKPAVERAGLRADELSRLV